MGVGVVNAFSFSGCPSPPPLFRPAATYREILVNRGRLTFQLTTGGVAISRRHNNNRESTLRAAS